MSAEKISSSDNVGTEESRGVKRPANASTEDPVTTATVHSVNDWEHVELGDDSRKSKFLRLMGANKKEHRGRFVIGDKKVASTHTRSAEDTVKLTVELEDQYRQGIDLRVSGGARRHKGLGFQGCQESTGSYPELPVLSEDFIGPQLPSVPIPEPELQDIPITSYGEDNEEVPVQAGCTVSDKIEGSVREHEASSGRSTARDYEQSGGRSGGTSSEKTSERKTFLGFVKGST